MSEERQSVPCSGPGFYTMVVDGDTAHIGDYISDHVLGDIDVDILEDKTSFPYHM